MNSKLFGITKVVFVFFRICYKNFLVTNLVLLQKLQLYAIVANGATIAGNDQLAKEFIHNARDLMGKLFDVSHPIVACRRTFSLVYQLLKLGAHFLMGFYYMGVGDIEKSSYHNALALQMCKNLMGRNA